MADNKEPQPSSREAYTRLNKQKNNTWAVYEWEKQPDGTVAVELINWNTPKGFNQDGDRFYNLKLLVETGLSGAKSLIESGVLVIVLKTKDERDPDIENKLNAGKFVFEAGLMGRSHKAMTQIIAPDNRFPVAVFAGSTYAREPLFDDAKNTLPSPGKIPLPPYMQMLEDGFKLADNLFRGDGGR